MYLKYIQYGNTPDFLVSEKYVNFSTTISDTGVVADEHGRKYVLAGTIIDVDGKAATASTVATKDVTGILFATVDVTYGPQPGALMVEGYVREARLQQAKEDGQLEEAIKTSLAAKCPKITLRP